MSVSSKFYVYELSDPRDGEVFYVGKGKGARWKQHAKEARRGKYSGKCQLIREIEADGFEYAVSFVGHYPLEADAYEAERVHIEKIGLDVLTNVIPGGTGGYEIWRKAKKLKPQQIVQSNAKHIQKVLLCSDLGLRLKIRGADIDLIALGKEVCLRLRDEVGVNEFNRVVKPFIVSNGVTDGI